MIARVAALAALSLVLSGCALIKAAEEPTDLYTVTPKSTFDANIAPVYWQLAVEVPVAASNLNTGRIAISMTPTSSDYYSKAAWTDRAPLMIQTRIGRPIMQRLHGTWSLGMVVGGATGWVASAADVPLRVHLFGASVFMVLVVLWAVRGLLGADDPPEPHTEESLASGDRPLLKFAVAIGAMGFGLALLEGMPNDWSSVVLHDVFHAGRLKGAGTSVFATAMLVGRLSGDHVSMAIGGRRMFTIGTGMCVAGSVILATAPVTALAFVAYALWGLGVSVLFPQLYELAARLPGVPPARGMGAMTFGQRLGFLSSAAVVGSLADLTNFRVTMFAVAGAAAALVLSARTQTH